MAVLPHYTIGMKQINLTAALDRLNTRYERATKFEQMLANVRFYRFDWSNYVPTEEFDEDLNPSFTKASTDVMKCRGFWTGLYNSLIGSHGNFEANDYNLFHVIGESGEELQSVIQFVSMTKAQMVHLEKIAAGILGDAFVVVSVNGDKVKGKDSEDYIKRTLRQAKKEGKHVWVLASQMCQRSFSIPEINTVLLSYDNGDKGATIQKMSRAMTSGNNKSIAHVVSLSIDGNRDEKISTIVMETAKKDADETDGDIVESVKKVLRTLPIFQMVDGDVEAIDTDAYAKELFASSNAHRLVVDRNRLVAFRATDESFSILSGIHLPAVELQKMEAAFKKGKTYKSDDLPQTRAAGETQKSLLEEIKNNLIKLTDRIAFALDGLKYFQEDLTLDSFLAQVQDDQDLQDLIQVAPRDLNTLLDEGYLNRNLLALLVVS